VSRPSVLCCAVGWLTWTWVRSARAAWACLPGLVSPGACHRVCAGPDQGLDQDREHRRRLRWPSGPLRMDGARRFVCARRFQPLRSILTEILPMSHCSCHEISRAETPGQAATSRAASSSSTAARTAGSTLAAQLLHRALLARTPSCMAPRPDIMPQLLCGCGWR
jgi:hypothetical protein